jgi:hypothetical protein
LTRDARSYAVPAVVISIALVVVLRVVFHSERHER